MLNRCWQHAVDDGSSIRLASSRTRPSGKPQLALEIAVAGTKLAAKSQADACADFSRCIVKEAGGSASWPSELGNNPKRSFGSTRSHGAAVNVDFSIKTRMCD